MFKTLLKIKLLFQKNKLLDEAFSLNQIENHEDYLKLFNILFPSVSKDQPILLEGVGKVYENGFKAIHNFNLKINPNEFVSFLGPSGCGKTTMLRMIAGLEYISEGSFKMGDVLLNSALPKERSLAMVFQNYALYPYKNVYNNISFGLEISTWSNEHIEGLIDEIKTIKNPNYLKIKEMKHEIWSLQNPNYYQIKQEKLKLIKSKKGLIDTSAQEIRGYIKQLKLQNSISSDTNKDKISELNGQISKLKGMKFSEIDDQKDKLVRITKKIMTLAAVWKASIPSRVEFFSKMVGIEKYLKRKPSELSGGQRQRVALVRAISKDARLYLFDEPLSNLDAKLRATMRSEIRKIHNQMNSISIFVTHDQVEAMTMSDKIVLMNSGYIQQVGTPSELFDHPANLFVADFIGTPRINFVNGILANSKKLLIHGRETTFAPSVTIDNNINEQHVVVGIRPQDVITDPSIIDVASENIFTVKVELIEVVGHEKIVQSVSKEFGEKFTFIANKYFDAKIGGDVKVLINPSRVHIFNKETGVSMTSPINKETSDAIKVWFESTNERIGNMMLADEELNKERFSRKIAKDFLGLINKSYGAKRSEQKEAFKNKEYKDKSIADISNESGGN